MLNKRTSSVLAYIGILSLLLTQCRHNLPANNLPTKEIPPQASETAPTSMTDITSQPPTPSQGGCVQPPTRITDREVLEFRWSSNSETMLFREKRDEAWFSYDIQSGQTKAATGEAATAPVNDISAFKLPDVREAYLSPSRQALLFTQGTPEKQDLYIKLKGDTQARFLGSLQGQIKKVDWLDGERQAIIAIDWQAPAGISEAAVYLADLSESQVRIKIPNLEEYRDIEYLGLTPDETRILFISFSNKTPRDRTVKLWNIKNDEITSTPIFNPLDYHWIDQNTLLSVGHQDADAPDISVMLYDLQTHQQRYLTDQGLKVHPFIPHAIQISPDHSAIAYIEDQTAQLYLLICRP